MVRYITALILLVGCQGEELYRPPDNTYLPAIAVATAIVAESPGTPDEPDTPSGDCETCDGRGWLGDNQPRNDCPDCNTKWDNHVFAEPLLAVDAQPVEQCDPDGCSAGGCDCADKFEAVQRELDEINRKLDRLEQLRASAAEDGFSKSAQELSDSTAEGDIPDSAADLSLSPPQPAGSHANGSGGSGTPRTEPPEAVKWVTLNEAQRSGKSVWIHVSASNCAPCVLAEQNLLSNPKVARASQDWACVKSVDDKTIVNRWRIATVPSDVFIFDGRETVMPRTNNWTVDRLVKFLEANK